MSKSGFFALWLALWSGGCVQQAVLENDVRSAEWKARTLSTAVDPNLAQAALSAQLVELEALYQRDPNDLRVRRLLARGYWLMADGFVELRRLEALAAADTARAEQERRLRSDAEARARYYGGLLPAGSENRASFDRDFAEPKAACARRDRAGYEARLNALLAKPDAAAERRLEHALEQRLAAAWLMPNVAARCEF